MARRVYNAYANNIRNYLGRNIGERDVNRKFSQSVYRGVRTAGGAGG